MKSIDVMTTGSTVHGLTSGGSELVSVESAPASTTVARMSNRRCSSSAHWCAQAGGRHDQRALAPSTLLQLRDHQAGLNRLSEADFVCEQKAGRAPGDERHRRFELKGKNVD